MIILKKEIVEAIKEYRENSGSIAAIAKKWGIDRHSLSKYINEDISKLIYFDNNYFKMDEKEILAINDYVCNNLNLSDIKKKYGYKHETFKKKLKVLSIKQNSHLKNINEDFFNEIDNEEKAYILGFILADGYINEPKGFIRIKVSNKDIDILKKMSKVFRLDDNDIKSEIHSETLNINSYITLNRKSIINRLKSYNIFQGKSGKEVPFYNILDNLKRHYIRGIFDGDGHVSSDFQILGFCGSHEVLTFIKNEINNNVSLRFNKNTQPKIYKEGNIYKLKYYGINIRNILEWMYKDSTIYLDRKYNIFLKEKTICRLK